MPGQHPIRTGDDRVIPFRPRASAGPAPAGLAAPESLSSRDALAAAAAPLTPSRLLTFTPRPRPAPRAAVPVPPTEPSAADLAAADLAAADERRRTLANVSALIFTLCLTAVAVWLATTIAEMRRTQDCVLVGRRDCGRVPLPPISTMRPERL
jgi:hypothetical protein